MRQAEDMLGKSKNYTLNSIELPQERDTENLSPPSNDDASNQGTVANVLPFGQTCTYTVMKGCESMASFPKTHSGNLS